MAIYREVRTEVYCDICGEQIVAFKNAGRTGGVSRGWAAYFARQEGCTTGKKVICKSCRIRVYDYDGCCIYAYYGEIKINSDGRDGKQIDIECAGYLEGYQQHGVHESEVRE